MPHEPTRPSWLCRECGDGWPCLGARAELAEQYEGDHVGLAVLLASYAVDASGELPDLPPVALLDRFAGWLRAL